MDEWSLDKEFGRTASIGTWQGLQVYNSVTTYKAYALEVYNNGTDELIGRLDE